MLEAYPDNRQSFETTIAGNPGPWTLDMVDDTIAWRNANGKIVLGMWECRYLFEAFNLAMEMYELKKHPEVLELLKTKPAVLAEALRQFAEKGAQ